MEPIINQEQFLPIIHKNQEGKKKGGEERETGSTNLSGRLKEDREKQSQTLYEKQIRGQIWKTR